MFKVPIIVLFYLSVLNLSHAVANNACEIDDELSQLADKTQLLMFGELHGTTEMVGYFSTVVCALANSKRPIKVGIEHPSNQLPLIKQFLNSPGNKKDRLELINSPYWAKDYQDGRTSQAMFELIDRIRQLRTSGNNIQIFVFDNQSQADRELALANEVKAELEKNPEVLHLLLTGNIHSQTMIGTPWDESYQPMGFHIKEDHPKLASIKLIHAGGDAWLCTTSCEKTYFKLKEKTGKYGRFHPVDKKSKHQYLIDVGVISTSYPALKYK